MLQKKEGKEQLKDTQMKSNQTTLVKYRYNFVVCSSDQPTFDAYMLTGCMFHCLCMQSVGYINFELKNLTLLIFHHLKLLKAGGNVSIFLYQHIFKVSAI